MLTLILFIYDEMPTDNVPVGLPFRQAGKIRPHLGKGYFSGINQLFPEEPDLVRAY